MCFILCGIYRGYRLLNAILVHGIYYNGVPTVQLKDHRQKVLVFLI